MAKSALTQDRATLLTKVLSSGGHNFTLGEIMEYGQVLNKLMSDNALEGVAGGVGSDMEEDFIITGALVLKGIAALTGGIATGAAVGHATRG